MRYRLALACLVVVIAAGCSARPAQAAVRTERMTSTAGQAELLLRPPGALRGLVVFMHGYGGDQNQLLDDSGLFPVRDALLKAGYAIVASNAHGDNFGNALSVQDQLDAVRDAQSRLSGPARVDVLAFSMGGLDALLVAAGHRITDLGAVALLSPVVDQTSFLGGQYANAIDTAFGHPAADQVQALVRQSDPVAQPAQDYSGYTYHFWHSPQDTTVPATQSQIMTNYLARNGISAAETSITGAHGDLSALRPQDVVQLFDAANPSPNRK